MPNVKVQIRALGHSCVDGTQPLICGCRCLLATARVACAVARHDLAACRGFVDLLKHRAVRDKRMSGGTSSRLKVIERCWTTL
jgi:hypothetical protein